jgi:hypothetical protein
MRRAALLLVCLLASSARAQMLSLSGPPTPDLVNLQSTVLTSIEDFKLRGTLLLAPGWSANLYAGDFHLSDSIHLADGAQVPRNLWSIDANVNHVHPLDDGRALGFSLGLGAVSDKPFHSLGETAINASATYRMPASGKNQWLFGINFSNNRPLINYVPLPIIAYLFLFPEQGLQGAIGFPFALVHWQIDPRWDLVASSIGFTTAAAELGLRLAPRIRLSTGFYWGQELWALADRTDTSSRLFYNAMRAQVKVELPLFHPLALDLSAGYVFDQRFFTGTSAYDRNDETSLADSWFVTAALKIPLGPAPR